MVFVASKNALVAGKNAAAYSSAKAAELHLARCLAEEGGGAGIRVNTVNPDAVLQGSRIWGSSWREERAASYGIEPDELEEHYRKRTTLGVNILPEDIADAVHALRVGRPVGQEHRQRPQRRRRGSGGLPTVRVALFITCFNDTLFPQTGQAVVTLLERLGHEVAFPEEQTCCGQMHFNTGYADDGLKLARRFERIFDPYEAIVSPSASCVGMVRDHCPAVASRVFELSEFLVDRLGVDDVGATFPHRVTLHPTCHSLRMLQVGDRPRRLLRAVRGIDLVELEDAQECCGFGGTFAVKNADTSMAMLSDKLRRILDTRAEVCTAADNSCLMHIGGGLRRQRAGVRAMHLAEILAAQE